MHRLIIYLFLGILSLSPVYGQKEKIEKLIPKEPIDWVSDFENVFTKSPKSEIFIFDFGLDPLSMLSLNSG